MDIGDLSRGCERLQMRKKYNFVRECVLVVCMQNNPNRHPNSPINKYRLAHLLCTGRRLSPNYVHGAQHGHRDWTRGIPQRRHLSFPVYTQRRICIRRTSRDGV